MKKILILTLSISLITHTQRLEASVADKVALGLLMTATVALDIANRLIITQPKTQVNNPKSNKRLAAVKKDQNGLIRECLDALTLNGIDRS